MDEAALTVSPDSPFVWSPVEEGLLHRAERAFLWGMFEVN